MESVAISTKTAEFVSELDNLSSERLGALLKYFLQSLMTGSSNVEIKDSEQSYLRAISTIVLEVARVQGDSAALANILKDNGALSCNAIVDMYEQHNATILAHLETTGISVPSIVGIDWRLDYSVRSKHGGRENVPMFFVTLNVIDRGVARDINLIATHEELRDLHSQVRNAVQTVEKVAVAVEGQNNQVTND